MYFVEFEDGGFLNLAHVVAIHRTSTNSSAIKVDTVHGKQVIMQGLTPGDFQQLSGVAGTANKPSMPVMRSVDLRVPPDGQFDNPDDELQHLRKICDGMEIKYHHMHKPSTLRNMIENKNRELAGVAS